MGSLHFSWASSPVCNTCRKPLRDGLIVGGMAYHQWCTPATPELRLLSEDDVRRVVAETKTPKD